MVLGLFNRRRSLKESGFFNGFIDRHSHILPGVDDGVRTMNEALEILDMYGRLGIGEVWLTPHIMEDTPNTTAGLRERFAGLQSAWRGEVELHLGAEYMLDNLFEKRLAAGDLLPVSRTGDHLLVETSCFTPPMDLHGVLERIRTRGYYSVLAHPERYAYMDRKEYRELNTRGVKMQLNVGSLAGFYGHAVKCKADWLLKNGMYSCAGTDLHHIMSLESIMQGKINKRFIGQLQNILI